MSPDPDPSEVARLHFGECTVMIANPNREEIIVTAQGPKVKRGVRRILSPKPVVLFR
jgi:hypothetical protein